MDRFPGPRSVARTLLVVALLVAASLTVVAVASTVPPPPRAAPAGAGPRLGPGAFSGNRTFLPIAGDPARSGAFASRPSAGVPTPLQTGNGGQIVARITTQGGAYPGVFYNRTGDVYFSDSGTDNVSVINTLNDSVVATIAVGWAPQQPCLDPVDGTLFVSNFYSDNISVISTATNRVIASISPVGSSEPTTCTYDPATGDVYIPNPNYGTNYANLSVVYGSNGTFLTNINLAYGTGIDPITPTIDPDNGLLYVAMSSAYYSSNWVEVVNASKFSTPATISVGFYPTQPVYDPVDHHLYVANNGGETVNILNVSDNTVLHSVVVGYSPSVPAVDPVSGAVFVPLYNYPSNGNLTVINVTTENISTVLPLGDYPNGPYADAQDGDLYVPEANQQNLTVVAMANDTVLGNYTIGSSPQTPVADAGGDLFVPYSTGSYQTGAVAVIAGPDLHATLVATPTPSYQWNPLTIHAYALGGAGTLTFDYDNLPTGCSTNDVVELNCTPEQAGTYDIGLIVFDTSGHEANASLNLTVLPATNVTFASSGLPAGDVWYANASGLRSISSTNPSVTVSLPTGVYALRVASANKDFAPDAPSGSLRVGGAPFTFDLNFTEVTYAMTFTASGLPNGTTWYVNASGGPSLMTTGGQLVLPLDNGSHPYTIASAGQRYGPSPGAGTLAVHGRALSVNVTFRYEAFSIAFDEAGLPAPDLWYVNVTGARGIVSSVAVSTLALSNGTYAYSIATADKSYAPTAAAGALVVNGSHGPVTVTFVPYTFPVTFQEVGLPSATLWSVHLGKTVASGRTAVLNASETNGTYDYSVTAIPGWIAAAYSGVVTVAGQAPTTVQVAWTQAVYAVTFTAQGLGSGAGWTLTVGNESYTAHGGSYLLSLPNGSYAYTFGSVGGYSLSNGTGELTVAGTTTGAEAFYSASGTGALGGLLLYGVLAAVAAIVVVAVVLVLRRRPRVPAPASPETLATGEEYEAPPADGN